jgi:hypothetical protein
MLKVMSKKFGSTPDTPPSLNVMYCAVKDHVTCDLAGEAVILQLNDGVYYGLNPVGASIWKLIQTPKTVQQIRDAVVEEYEVTPERCEADLELLLREFQEHKLVTVTPAD